MLASVGATSILDLKDKGFVKVQGKIVFEDYAKILYTLEHFNDIGIAIGQLTLPDVYSQSV